jgi:hypothetical protein
MHHQNQIKRTLRGAGDFVGLFIAERPEHSRNQLATELCEHFNFFDAGGNVQKATCLKALRDLATEGVFTLPPPRIERKGAVTPRRLSEPVPAPQDVPHRVDLIKNLELRLVRREADSRRWNEVIIREHPFGNRRLVGRQLRYLIESEHGCLGAIGFSSAALQLKDRDEWIGWSPEQREQHLDQIICLSRLLIRPGVECANLVSKVLGLLNTRFVEDFQQRYTYRPWLLETFVESDHHDGASLRAANWMKVGRSQGRGRQDRDNLHKESIKDIYMYELDEGFRDSLGVSRFQRHPPCGVEEGLGDGQWAKSEFGEAELGDKRLSKRLVSIVHAKGAAPGVPFSQAVNGRAADLAGYYRFFDQPDNTKTRMTDILAPHRQRTLCRMQDQEELLCVHDTTDLNYSTLLACEGLGVIGKNQTGTKSGGLRLHSSYVLTAEEGLPLGLLDWQCYAPEIKGAEDARKDSRRIAKEEKESYRWIKNLHGCMAHTDELAEKHITHIMDREGDFFDLFDQWRERGKDDLLIRARYNRPLPTVISTEKNSPLEEKEREASTLFEAVSGLKEMGRVEVTVPRKSARGKKGKKSAHGSQPKRTAQMVLRWMETEIHPPRYGLNSKKEPVTLWIIHAREEGPTPPGVKPIEWFLLSSAAVETQEVAIKCLGYYAKRWRIEDWHRILKTCCRVEEPAHDDAECLKQLIAINMVIAWRIHLMTLLGREMPELSMELMFDDMEIRVLNIMSKQMGWPVPENLGEAVIATARMGGYMNRKHDPPPGAELLWRGHQKLTLLSQGLSMAQLE